MAKTFGAQSTGDEVLEGVDLTGKRVLVTGVSAGLGVETARSIAAHGGTVVGTARDLAKARRALTEAFPKGASLPVELVELARCLGQAREDACIVVVGDYHAKRRPKLPPSRKPMA